MRGSNVNNLQNGILSPGKIVNIRGRKHSSVNADSLDDVLFVATDKFRWVTRGHFINVTLRDKENIGQICCLTAGKYIFLSKSVNPSAKIFYFDILVSLLIKLRAICFLWLFGFSETYTEIVLCVIVFYCVSANFYRHYTDRISTVTKALYMT